MACCPGSGKVAPPRSHANDGRSQRALCPDCGRTFDLLNGALVDHEGLPWLMITHSEAAKIIVRRASVLAKRISRASADRRDREEHAALLFLLDAMRELLAKAADPGKEVRELRARVALLEAEAKTNANRLSKAKAKLRAARGDGSVVEPLGAPL